MLNNSAMCPAFAVAGADPYADNSSATKNFAALSSSEDDDFNAFGDTSQKPQTAPQRIRRQQPDPRAKKPKKKLSPVNMKMILIGVAVIVAITLLIVLFSAIFSSPGKSVKTKDNVYIVYTDVDGHNRIMSNGKEIKETFEGDIKLIPSKDNSFAYVFEEIVTESGGKVTVMYILDGKKLSLVDAEADQIIAYADYKPGIIFKRGTVVQLFSENSFEDISSDSSSSNFLISGDASTVVYTEKNGRDPNATQIKYFCNAGFNDVGDADDLAPVAISSDGKYVYVHDSNNALYYLEVTKRGTKYKQNEIIPPSSNVFGGISAMNASGNEIIFNYKSSDDRVASFIFKIGEKKYSQIGEGVFTFAPTDKVTVAPSSLLGSYFTSVRAVTNDSGKSENVTSTYYYGSKGMLKLADATGQFAPNGKYFYYIDRINSDLVRVDLGSSDYEEGSKVISKAIDSFVLTEKGDLYTYSKPTSSAGGRITFKKSSDSTSRLVSSKSDANSMFACGSTVYFSETENDQVKIYKSTSGAAKEEISFKKVDFASAITIVMGSGNKGYAYCVDANGNTKLLYTSNGEKFDVILDACTIPGYNTTPEN